MSESEPTHVFLLASSPLVKVVNFMIQFEIKVMLTSR